MTTLILNPKLKYEPPYKSKLLRADGTPVPVESESKKIYKQTIAPENVAEIDYKVGGKEFTISSSFNDKSGDLFHISYADYLVKCYAVHHSIVISPDIIWYTIIGEVAKKIVSNPKPYSDVFTTSPDNKQKISVPTSNETYLPLDLIIEELKARVPVDSDLFLPEFSTTSEMSRLACYASFAEMCSPYYNYSTFCCGFPSIEIIGTIDDYEKVIAHLLLMDAAFADVDDNGKVRDYLEKVGKTIIEFMDALAEQDTGFFDRILTTKRCGSGSQIELDGWWVRNMYFKDYKGSMPHNLPTSVARVPYKNKDTGREFTVNFGLFYSNLVGDFMVPQFGYVRNELKKD